MKAERYAELRRLVEERGDCVEPSMLGECLDALVAAERIAVALADYVDHDGGELGREYNVLKRSRAAQRLGGAWREAVAAMRERQR